MVNHEQPLTCCDAWVTRRPSHRTRRTHVIVKLILSGCLSITLALSPSIVTAQSLSQRLKLESTEQLAVDARQKGDAIAGAILFTRRDLACAQCHDSSSTNPIGPNLRRLGEDVTDVHLVESLLEPSKVIRKDFESVRVLTDEGRVIIGRLLDDKPESIVLIESSREPREITLAKSNLEQITTSRQSTMPDNLVDQLTSRKQFLDLARYLMELASTGNAHRTEQTPPAGKSIRLELQGLVLLKEFNCAACHQDDLTQTQLASKQAPVLSSSISRLDPAFLRRYIANPHAVKPGTTMPDLMTGLSTAEREAAADEITHYLVSQGEHAFTRQSIDANAAKRGKDLFHSVGCVACHAPRDEQERTTLATSSVPLGPIADKYSSEGLIAFLKDPTKTRRSGRMPKMQLNHWEAVDVASYLISLGDPKSAARTFDVNPALAEKGKRRVEQLGCQQCHSPDQAALTPPSMPLARVRANRGCLSGQPGSWPLFELTDTQRTAMKAALSRQLGRLSQQDQINITLTAFRCLNCHQRDELGGVTEERNPHFQTTDPNLGPQGRLPPSLTGVGAKLKPTWMRQVMVSGRRIRPYVLTRMPQYGTENIEHLIELFQQTDQPPAIEFASIADQKETRKVGGEMVGDRGLNCIACHSFQLKKAANMSAVDLTEMAERLHKTWFYQYMRDPQRFSANTIMPTFWPGGKVMRRDLLDGDADQQIEALWQYLLDGRQARAPRGLIREPIELLATDEAVMLRRSYPGIGKRGIGVGFPAQVNLAFDAEQLRLAMIWRGKFADPGGVWRSQGHGRVRPLGEKPVEFARGPDLDRAEQPWVVDEGRPPDHQFTGYSLDEKMRPRFRYRFLGMQVEDYSIDRVDSDSDRPFLQRSIRIHTDSAREDLMFRAADGQVIKRKSDQVFIVDDRLDVRVIGIDTARVTDSGDRQRLVIPLNVAAGDTELNLQYRWLEETR